MTIENPPPSADGEDTDPQAISRRAFLRYTIGAVGSFVGIAAGVPILGYVTSVLEAKGQAQWIRVGSIEGFPNGVPHPVAFTLIRQDGWVETRESRSCWVVRDGDKLIAFNGRCPHLGCAYSWRTEGTQANRFYCPCHGGVYSLGGQVVDGPPPRALDRLTTRVENGDLYVLYQDFRLGVPEKVPL